MRLEKVRGPRVDFKVAAEALPRILSAIRSWVATAQGEKLELLLRAVDAMITASDSEVKIRLGADLRI
jgi:hypothetical protein